MKKWLFLILLFLGLTGCGGGGTDSATYSGNWVVEDENKKILLHLSFSNNQHYTGTLDVVYYTDINGIGHSLSGTIEGDFNTNNVQPMTFSPGTAVDPLFENNSVNLFLPSNPTSAPNSLGFKLAGSNSAPGQYEISTTLSRQ